MRLPGPLDRVVDVAGHSADTVDRLVRLLPRVGVLLDSVEQLLERAGALMTRLEQCEVRVERVISNVSRSEQDARQVINATGRLELRVRGMIDTCEPVAAPLLDQVQQEVLPVLSGLRTIGPDLRELLAVSAALNEMMGSVPGLGRAKKRAEADHSGDPSDDAPPP